MSLKILCTGNPNVPGIAYYIKEIFPDTIFISRSNGFDLLTNQGLDKFKNVIKNYNIFINHSQLIPTGQVKLLKIVHDSWSNGHVINIGSVLEFEKWKWIDIDSAREKIKLKELSLELNSENFKTSHIIIGGLRSTDNDTMRLDPKEVAESIKWILERGIHIPLLYIDHVSDQLTEDWLKKKSVNQ
jgi:hypothetical protein